MPDLPGDDGTSILTQHEWFDVYDIHGGKYTSPKDPMGFINKTHERTNKQQEIPHNSAPFMGSLQYSGRRTIVGLTDLKTVQLIQVQLQLQINFYTIIYGFNQIIPIHG